MIGDVVYIRMKVVAVDTENQWGDTLRGVPVDKSGKVDESGGQYVFRSEHTVTAGEVIKAVRRLVEKEHAELQQNPHHGSPDPRPRNEVSGEHDGGLVRAGEQ